MRIVKTCASDLYILAVENIAFSYLDSSSRESTNDIAANYVFCLILKGLLMTPTSWMYCVFKPTTYMVVSKA